MMRAAAVAFCLTTLVPPGISAETIRGQCELAVAERSYLQGPCSIDMDKDGSFSIGTDGRSKYFAYVTVDTVTGNAKGYWNGYEAASHAHEDLGTLVRKGACWVNGYARVCARR
jgi:hypothetical protein